MAEPSPSPSSHPAGPDLAKARSVDAPSVPVARRTWSFARFLLGAAVLVSAADWWWPLRGLLSFAAAGALCLLALPWAFLIFRREQGIEAGAASAALRPDLAAARPKRLLPAALVVIMLAFLTAKWLVLLHAQSSPAGFVGSSRSYTFAFLLVFVFGLVARDLRFARFVALVVDHPARLMALSFGVTGVLGAFLLSLPVCVHSVRNVSLIDSLFTAFSAVCVTGLAVNNVAETYTRAGQVVICALIQIGGLGIMVLSAAISVLAGRRMRVKSSAVLAEMVDVRSLAHLRRTLLMILLYTLVIEAAGATLLYAEFERHPDTARHFGGPLAGAGDPRWAAVFHAVSAFCNAGFSNFSAGLVPFVGSPLVTLTISALVLLGGIGFPVLDELLRTLFTRLRMRRAPVLSLNTRVALRVSGILLVLSTFMYLIFEWRSSMRELSLFEHVLASIFQAASSRTAGFNVIDIGSMLPAVLALTCFAMFIGASPGGTGGGIKTTTFAVLLAGVRSELSGRPARLLNRLIPESVTRRAISVAFLSSTVVAASVVALLLLEPHPPLELAFEAVSAFSTTGLSTGVTPELSTPGKLLITLLMFVGRIGPLTFALALAQRASLRSIQLPEERVMIG